MDNKTNKPTYDQLAAENALLKSRSVTVPAKVYVKDMRCNVVRWAQVVDALSDAGVAFVRDDGELIAGAAETPATDAYLSQMRNEELPTEIAEIIDSGDLETICYESERSYAEDFRLALYRFRQRREGKAGEVQS